MKSRKTIFRPRLISQAASGVGSLSVFAEGTNLIPLASDVMEVFFDAESVNEALG